MKKVYVLVVLAIVLCSISVWLSGCTQPGETAAEGRRRHIRNSRINRELLAEDVDSAFLFDQPSKLSDKRIP